MGQHDACGTAPCNTVSDTIAFGSMLVFASVMPPLDPDAAKADAGSVRTRVDAPAGIGSDTVRHPATQSRRRFDS